MVWQLQACPDSFKGGSGPSTGKDPSLATPPPSSARGTERRTYEENLTSGRENEGAAGPSRAEALRFIGPSGKNWLLEPSTETYMQPGQVLQHKRDSNAVIMC